MSITEKEIQEIEGCDEYSFRHYGAEICELIDSYRQLVWLLDDAGVLQLDDEWAKKIQAHVEGVNGEQP